MNLKNRFPGTFELREKISNERDGVGEGEKREGAEECTTSSSVAKCCSCASESESMINL